MGQRHTTHVANAYSEEILVKITADRQYEEQADNDFGCSTKTAVDKLKNARGVDIKVKRKYIWKFAKKNGFTRIKPGSYLGFNPDGNRDCVYITIKTKNGDEICENYCLTKDYSVIVDKDGYIQGAQYGSIWVDTSGNNHKKVDKEKKTEQKVKVEQNEIKKQIDLEKNDGFSQDHYLNVLGLASG